MSETSKPIAFRVSPEVDEQIQEIAKANNQTKSEWVRDQVMEALYSVQQLVRPESEPCEPTSQTLLDRVDAQIQDSERRICDQLAELSKAVRAATTSHHDDLSTLAQVGLAVEESMEERIESSCTDVLDAIERLKQSQRSHKDSVLAAFSNIWQIKKRA
jgi:uncharacterized protein (DUF1778 family)